MLLLDTHAWVWLVGGDKRIKSNAWLKPILKAAQRHEVYVASISVWEVGMLVSHGRLKLDRSVHDWVERAIGLPGLSLVQLEPKIAIDSSQLPANAPPDPADRIIIATARHKQLALVTADQRIVDYAEQGFLQIL